jgi:hypothetical protein
VVVALILALGVALGEPLFQVEILPTTIGIEKELVSSIP